LTPEERLDRYATLFRWQTEDEINIKKLIDQWDADKMGVMAMMNQARRNPKLYDELRSLGYGDDEFPDWWYSPARSTEMKTDEPKMKKDDPPIKQEQPGTKTMDKDVLTPPDPKTPVSTLPIERVSSRPRLPDPIPSDRDPSEVIVPDPSTSRDGLTRSEIDLLGSRGIVRGEDGIWKHIETEPSGRTIITPVNPLAELQRLSSQAQGDAILQNVNKHMIEQLEISTQAIIKKVALNPTVFWLFQYVTSIRDKNTGLPLFVGDIGDFLSFCARFTGEAYYGVVPTYVTNRPSFLTTLHQQQMSTYAGQPQLTYNQLQSARREEERTQ